MRKLALIVITGLLGLALTGVASAQDATSQPARGKGLRARLQARKAKATTDAATSQPARAGKFAKGLKADKANRVAKADRIPARFSKLDLTDAQKASIKDILIKAHADAKAAATKKDKHAIHKAAHTKIVNEVLTDAQRAKLKELAQERKAKRAAAGKGHVRAGKTAKTTTQPS